MFLCFIHVCSICDHLLMYYSSLIILIIFGIVSICSVSSSMYNGLIKTTSNILHPIFIKFLRTYIYTSPSKHGQVQNLVYVITTSHIDSLKKIFYCGWHYISYCFSLVSQITNLQSLNNKLSFTFSSFLVLQDQLFQDQLFLVLLQR